MTSGKILGRPFLRKKYRHQRRIMLPCHWRHTLRAAWEMISNGLLLSSWMRACADPRCLLTKLTPLPTCLHSCSDLRWNHTPLVKQAFNERYWSLRRRVSPIGSRINGNPRRTWSPRMNSRCVVSGSSDSVLYLIRKLLWADFLPNSQTSLLFADFLHFAESSSVWTFKGNKCHCPFDLVPSSSRHTLWKRELFIADANINKGISLIRRLRMATCPLNKYPHRSEIRVAG